MFSIFRVSQIDQNNDSSPLLLNLLSFGPKKIMTRLCQRNIAIPCCCSCYPFEKQTILIITMGEIKLLLIFLFFNPQILILDRLSATVRQWDLCALFNCGCCFRLFPGYFSRCLPNLYIFLAEIRRPVPQYPLSMSESVYDNMGANQKKRNGIFPPFFRFLSPKLQIVPRLTSQQPAKQ